MDEDSDDENLKNLTGTRKTHTGPNRNQIPDTRERIALDISLLKKQYSKLRERQRHTNLTNPTKQMASSGDGGNNVGSNNTTKSANINQYLIGRNAIVSNKKRHGPPAGSIPPVRTTLPMSVANKYQQKRLRNATIDNTSTSAMQLKMRGGDDNSNVQKKKTFTRHRSESSSYSEDSDKGSDDELDNRLPIESSSSSTSLCDDEFGSIGNASSMDASPMKSRLHSSASDDSKSSLPKDESVQYKRFQADDVDGDGGGDGDVEESKTSNIDRENNDIHYRKIDSDGKPEKSSLDLLSLPQREAITSTSQLSPIENISTILSISTISPLKTPTSYLLQAYPLCDIASSEENNQDESSEIDFSLNTGSSDKDFFKVSDEGVTNAYFERINHVATVTMDSKFPFSFIEDAPDDTNLESRLSRSSQEEEDDDDDDEDGSSFKSEVRRLSDSFESSIILIDQADQNLNKTSPCTSNPNTNSDAILKMIEENSKILDRIMCKNAQATANSIKSLDKDQTESFDSEVNVPIAKNDTDQFASIPTVEITSHEYVDEKIDQSDAKPSMDKDINPLDSHVFKYGDLSDCISKYLISTNEKAEQRAIHGETGRTSIQEHEMVINKSNENKLNLPQTLTLLSNDAGSTEDIRALLEESFHGYCKSPSELLPIDSKLENDLETLLKMSAELLHDYPFKSKTLMGENNLTENNDGELEHPSMDIIPTSIVDMESKDATDDPIEKSTYLDADALQMEMESVAGDISATISSIKNTIKSIDSLCQEDDRRSRTDKTLDDIIKVVEKLDEEKDNRKTHDTKSIESAILSTVYEHTARPIEHNLDISSLDSPRLSSRISRDRSRMTSPRRRKDDDFGEYDSRARRAKSPSSSIFNESCNRYSDDFTTKFKFDDVSSGSDSGSKSKLSSPYKMPEKLEIRHTTVTATFYDRFLSQKYEQQHKSIDRSPSSPVINKAYLNSLKPTPSLTSSYSSCSDKCRRDSRSTSPLPSSFLSERNQSESSKYVPSAPKSGHLHLPQLSIGLLNRDPYTRSCDNILSNLSSTSSSSDFTPRYSYQTTKTSSDIFSANSSRSIDTENILKRHSTGTYYQNSTVLPIKPKKPSEIGIKLGLYKPE